ncbi:sulfite oxidase heme-binding subunit YedZ [Phreatobacter cathodiphilus]|uniref:Protein-methionine-sulfoxide reductase heme-binding subunit MsrQ n=1 Tax=Phreatobacter cathodiphilus TaxID=1868589 RepID=A0A2S0N725_9HYPH|nr:ferric reductase-like transmembrane domain-containing protein [Phreatobacter cathodiphilus]AVO43743.1 sulfoxide reductase heme-binding subunit YedZ [Phreatobacter cathodiphilus]
MLPWNDRAGRLSVLKLIVFLGVLAPGLYIAAQAATGTLGSKPITSAIHQSGDWAVRLLLVSLLVTPLRFIADWPKLILVRRMVGVAAAAYALAHLLFYVVEQAFDLQKVASEILLRFYLTIGFVGLGGLVVLAATSTDAMIRRLGSTAWNRLHLLTYPIAFIAIWHFFLQTKIDVSQPVLMLGFFVWLMAFRAMRAAGIQVRPLQLAGLAIISGVATALLEALWYATMTGVMASRILYANLDVGFGIRPALWVTMAGLALVAVNLVRARKAGAPRGRRAAVAAE